ncbi:hypothetical protein [Clostridium beijerinckii]|uniref:hypothetical protein n=1 Tax=Clostridium beijerinckii TaxID=1520 RepID=UPI0024313290|nr:hypothetical protein [Clostridium beijerinckii]MDG5855264.1 hypothetical protein [Clostridium beijerinckii]
MLIGIPVMIYSGIKLPIEFTLGGITNDASGWLSFWGSFLGGIFGGLATLIGVKLSIVKADKEKKEERKPLIIPKTKQLSISGTYEHLNLLNSGSEAEWGLININLFNGSRETALEIELGWDEPNLKDINKCKDLTIKEKEEYKDLAKEIGADTSTKSSLNMLASLQEDEIILPFCYQTYIEKLLEQILKKNYEEKLIIKRNVPLGNISIQLLNIYKEKVIDIYEVTGFIHAKDFPEGKGYLILDFKLIDKK